MRKNARFGYASVLAMLLLVLGFTLCAWLFTSVSNATAVTRNEFAAAKAMASAESGLASVMYQLRKITAKEGFKGTPETDTDATVRTEILRDLCRLVLERKDDIAQSVVVDQSIPQFLLDRVALADKCDYSAEMTALKLRPINYGHAYTVQVTGRSGDARKVICLDLTPEILPGTSALDYAIASRYGMGLPSDGNGNAGVYRYDPATGQADRSDLGEAKQAPDGSWYIEFGNSPAPEGDMVFPAEYLPAGVYQSLNAMVASGELQTVSANAGFPTSNIYIPRSDRNNPRPVTFENTVISGIIYVGWPNEIVFGENVTFNGVIVYEKPTRPVLLDPEDASPSRIVISKESDLTTDLALATTSVQTFLGQSSLLPAQQEEAAEWLNMWTIHAPNTDLALENGSTNPEPRTLDGNLHVRDVIGIGAGHTEADNLIIKGQIVAEGTVKLNGTRIFCIESPVASDNPDAERRIRLDASRGAYWEPAQ